MTNCNQICIYNFGDDGCLKPEWQPCRMSNTKPPRVTNADIVRFMSNEAFAAFLEDFTSCKYCSEYEKEEFDDYGIQVCDGECKQHMLDWLQQPAED